MADTARRDSPLVLQLTTLLRRLGPAGAAANVRAVLDDRTREDWLIAGLVDRLAPAPAPGQPLPQPAAPAAA